MRERLLSIPPCDEDRAWNVVDAVFRLPKDQRPTAAVCFNDYMAVSLAERLEYLGSAGRGASGAAYEEIGMAAVDLLRRRIQEPSAPPKSVELPVRLITRASSLSQPAH